MMAHVNRLDRPLPQWADKHWNHIFDEVCPKCRNVTYGLWYSDIRSPDPDEERELKDYVLKALGHHCPGHPDFFMTPDMT